MFCWGLLIFLESLVSLKDTIWVNSLEEQESPRRGIFRRTVWSDRIPEPAHMDLDTVSRIHVAHPRERHYHVIPQAMRRAPVIKLDSRVKGQGMNVARLHREVTREPVHTLGVFLGVGIHGMPLGHHFTRDGASEGGIAAAIGSGLGGGHMLPAYHNP